MNSYDKISDFINTFEDITKNSEEFLDVQKDGGENVKGLVKNIYDFVKSLENKSAAKNALPELIIESFDEEQIWQEIELQNNDNVDQFESEISLLSEKKDEIIFSVQLRKEGTDDVQKGKKETKKSRNKNVKLDEEEDCDDADEVTNNSKEDKLDFETDNESVDSEVTKTNSKKGKKGKLKPSIVDDEFFKLSELEEFLLSEEKREKKERDEMEFGIDLFGEIPSSDEEDADKDQVRYRYKDFFAEPSNNREKFENDKDGTNFDEEESGGDYVDEDMVDNDGSSADEDDNEELNDSSKVNSKTLSDSENDLSMGDEEEEDEDKEAESSKRVRFNLSEEEGEEEESSDDEDLGSDAEKENIKEKTVQVKSTLEKRKDRLSKHIQKLEEQALSEKPWQMKGEITAGSRPQNSLLEEVLEFDMTSRPAPVMTQETTERLEDIIIRRIKDKAWDDVERKLKPVETVNEFKKRLVLDQEKSKLSLSQIYEQEYIKQRDSATAVGLKTEEKEPEELPEHKQIKTMMVTLFSKLNALANFHYTPKPAAPDIKIVSNLPAITMEEVAPVSASDATLLAPEEVMGKKKKDLVGKEERTRTDKKRERRRKKNWQKIKRKVEEAKEVANVQKSKKYSVEKATKDLKKLANNRGVQIESSGNKKTIKTSTAFFSRLQDEVKSSVHGKLKGKKKDKNVVSAKKLKL